MGLPDHFMWGGASAANQCEGGISEGGRGLANVDVCPAGPDRRDVITGHKKMLRMDQEHRYPAAEGVDFYHRFREDIRLMGPESFRTGRKRRRMKKDFCSMKMYLKNAENIIFVHW